MALASFRFCKEINVLKADYIQEMELYTLVALDLMNSVHVKSEDHMSYLDLSVTQSEEIPFPEHIYMDFLYSCLQHFTAQFQACLLHDLKVKTNQTSACDLLTLLMETEANSFSQNIIERLLQVFTVTEGFIFEEIAVDFFDKISNILYYKQYRDPKLSVILIQAISCDHCFPPDVLSLAPADKLDYVLANVKFHYISTGHPQWFRFFQEDNSILQCIYFGTTDVLKVMLSYGNWDKYSETRVYEWYWRCFMEMNNRNGQKINYLLMTEKYCPKRYILMLQLYFVMSLQTKHRRYHLQMIKLFWKSIPDPFIVAQEMYAVLGSTGPDNSISEIRLICKKYQKILCPGCLKPRSLMHYTRCVIRSVMCQNCALPEGIDFLGLPAALKSYLKLDR